VFEKVIIINNINNDHKKSYFIGVQHRRGKVLDFQVRPFFLFLLKVIKQLSDSLY